MTKCKTCDNWFMDGEINNSNECPDCAKKNAVDHEKAAQSIRDVWANKNNKIKILK